MARTFAMHFAHVTLEQLHAAEHCTAHVANGARLLVIGLGQMLAVQHGRRERIIALRTAVHCNSEMEIVESKSCPHPDA